MTELLSTLAEVTLIGGMSIVLEAIDPTTGAAVTGVTVTNVAIYAETGDGDGFGTEPVVELVEPLFVPLPITAPADKAGP